MNTSSLPLTVLERDRKKARTPDGETFGPTQIENGLALIFDPQNGTWGETIRDKKDLLELQS